MPAVVTLVFLFLTLLLLPVTGAAQQPPPVTETTIALRHEVISDREHRYFGNVEISRGDTKLYADEVQFLVDESRALATGNVVFRQGSNQIAADRADFNTDTRLGIFYNATGFANVDPPARTAAPGGVAPPPVPGEQTVVYFFGETVEKIGPRKYLIAKGGFTTCVQPTPRWDMHAGTITLNLDHYTLLTNMVMNVKGVPLLYLPIMYYPTNREDRATGFLLPTYGVSSLRGHSFHNAFFWAIDRSQDATVLHDWFSKTGQGMGTEYRYNFGAGSDGTMRAYLLNQQETIYSLEDGSQQVLPAERSYDITGAINQGLPHGLRARARVDYFSSIATNQTYNTNLNDASRSQRRIGGNVDGRFGTYSLSGMFDRREYFYSHTSSSVSGSWPRVSLTRNERPVPGTLFYIAASGEAARLLSVGRETATEFDRGLTRVDVAPRVRIPFTRLQWFTANSTVSWRDTFYSRSYLLDESTNEPALDPVTRQAIILDTNLNRQYFTLQTQLTGPVLNRIWDTPDNGYAERFKHTIEPYLNVRRTSSIDEYDRIVQLESSDQVVGGATQYTYGVANRVYAKRRGPTPGQPSQAREIVAVDLQQTYYTDELAAQVDLQYSTSNSGAPPSRFSPLAVTVRAQPTGDFNATARAEFDSRYLELRTISTSATYTWSSQLQSSLGWSKRAFIQELPGFNDPARLDHTLNGSASVRTRNNGYGGIYSFNYDVLNGRMVQQRISAFYNAQCCGVAFEYQNYRFGTAVSPISSDRRFFMSFTLAGLGNFSPFNGALGGIPR
jgi:LPS-assembly protein